jgi:ribosome assembly protein 1
MDRLIVELQMTPHEAYIHINKILEQVNAVMATFFTGDLMESEYRKMTDEKEKEKDNDKEEEEFDANKVYDWSVEDRDDSDIYFDPARGNVIFSSAVDGWAFRYNT